MLRAVPALLLLIVVIAGFSGEARAHAGMAGHGSEVAGDAAAVSEAAAVPAGTERSPDHLPAGECCMTTAGCGNAGSILAGTPLLPVPGGAATAEPAAMPDVPDSLDLPVADRPPRSA